jgi:phenylpyruvate tautomerase PptA (4-oxalocrotonate tautomerase family)
VPIVRIDLSDRRTPAQRRAISDGVHRAFVDAVGIPPGDRFHVVTTHPAGELIADPEFLDVRREDVVYLQITLVRGRPTELKQALYRRIVEELVGVGVRAEDVAIVLTENDPVDYSWGNGEAQLLGRGPVPGAGS